MIPWDLLIFVALGVIIVFLAIFCLMRLIESLLFRRLSMTADRPNHQTLLVMAGSLKRSWLFLTLIIASYFALQITPISSQTQESVNQVFFIIFIVYFTWLIHRLITCQTESLIADRKDKRRSVTSFKFFNRIFDIFLWIGVGLLIIFMLGYDITVLLAGLGIGGILFAVASQKIFADLFYSFALHSDHVFEEGDFIIIGDFRGSPGNAGGRIERIGLRSTHLRAPTGESIIVANQELTSKIIYNYSKKKDTRMSLLFSVSYETKSEKLGQLDKLVNEVLARQNLVRCGQVLFREFGPNGPSFELVYDLETSDYSEMQSVHRQISLTLKEKLDQAGIKMAGG